MTWWDFWVKGFFHPLRWWRRTHLDFIVVEAAHAESGSFEEQTGQPSTPAVFLVNAELLGSNRWQCGDYNCTRPDLTSYKTTIGFPNHATCPGTTTLGNGDVCNLIAATCRKC